MIAAQRFLIAAVLAVPLGAVSALAQENSSAETQAPPSDTHRAVPRESPRRETPSPRIQMEREGRREEGRRAVPRESAPPTAPVAAPQSRDRGARTPDGSSRRQVPADVPAHSRPRGGNPPTGEAVPRTARPAPPHGTIRHIPSYRPYYHPGSRYYSPWGYGAFGLGYFYYDPAWWGYPSQYGYSGPAVIGWDGSLKLKVKPRDAQVLIDGYYVGVVDEFDGIFQSLRLPEGPHRVEIRAPGFEPLVFEVRILADDTVTYRGTLRPLP
jgi:hypothetical protein